MSRPLSQFVPPPAHSWKVKKHLLWERIPANFKLVEELAWMPLMVAEGAELGGPRETFWTWTSMPGVVPGLDPNLATLRLAGCLPLLVMTGLGEAPIVSEPRFILISFLISLYLNANVIPTFWLGYYIVIHSRRTTINKWFYFWLNISLFGKFICCVMLLVEVGRRSHSLWVGGPLPSFLKGKVLTFYHRG